MHNLILIANSAQDQQSTSSLLFTFAPIVLVVIIFYFLLIRPQKKREGEAKAMRENVQIGDEIVTIGGIIGIVVKKTENTIVIETGGDKSKLRIKIDAIQENVTLTEKAEAAKKAKTAERMEMIREKREEKQNNKKKK